MLHSYYTNLDSFDKKTKFKNKVAKRCRVQPSTVSSWIAKPEAVAYRNPKPIYWKILSDITGIKESELFN